MAAIWILLAKSKYPATLFQTFKGEVSKAIVPFDVTVEVVPQLLSEPDRFWQHLVEDGPEETPGFSSIVGNSAPLKMAMGRAKRAAIFDVTVLILGESGTGKELFGRAIHEASQRRNGPFVTINCAAISKELLESELFGHVKGSFTGAEKDRAGAFELANGGTLFLDEVGECDLAMQAKILRALQPPPGESPSKRVFRRVGATKDTVADVRVVAATNRDLASEINAGNFREDLFYRLAMITVKLPPLRQRKGDIKLLAKSLLTQINEQFTSTERPGYIAKSLPNETLKYLESYHWPGNVRELYNALVQSAIMQDAEKLRPRDLAASLATMPSQISKSSTGEVVLGDGFDVDEYLDEIHAELIRKAMSQSGNVKKRAAELLGVKNYQTLAARLERLDIR
jgi:transcriptional regulator with PAS, ATPase and Fis domain